MSVVMPRKSLNRKQRRALERKRKKRAKEVIKRKRHPKRFQTFVKTKQEMVEKIKQMPTPTLSDVEKAKRKAESSIKKLKYRLIEVQSKVNRMKGIRRNYVIDLINAIKRDIKQHEELIEAYNAWAKRDEALSKIAKETEKEKIKEKNKNATK